jgi:biotin-(acetyl-CoA carboxylase) ligase
LRELEARLALLEAGDLEPITRELSEHDALNGRRVRVEGRAGVARGIDAAGRLLLELDGGDLAPIASGHVELL